MMGTPISAKEQIAMKITAARPALLIPAALAWLAAAASAQAPPDFSKVEIKTTKVGSNFYTLEGQGGMIGVLTGPDGTLMVDSQFAPLTDKIVAAIHQISSGPIRFMINTHVHPDHTGGNENLGKMGVAIFSREELRDRLAQPIPPAGANPGRPPMPPAALPLITYRGRTTFHMNGEEVDLIPIPRAHTDGDTLVRFKNADVLMTGDYFRSVGFPNIDRANGGSLNGMLEGLGVTIGLAGPNTKIIPGHGPTVDRMALIAHRDMILGVRDKVAKLVQQGKSADETLAAHPTSDYDSKIPQAQETSQRFVGQLYAELKPAK
jgi:glyoxylase-like metal-dependent hydrolase (beta-lactamase superfamily II)